MPFPIESQACSTWALSGDESRATRIHTEFSTLTDRLVHLDPRQRREQHHHTTLFSSAGDGADRSKFKFCGKFKMQ